MESEEVVSGINQVFNQPITELLLKIVLALTVVVIGRLLANWAVRVVKRSMVKANMDETLVSFLGNVTYYTLLVIIVVLALGIVGFPTTSLVAILGAATLAIGFALQDFIANLASGVTIVALRPFQVGDYVETASEDGFVTDIRLFHTTLTTRDNKLIYLPNKDVIGGNITNYSNTPLIRLDLVFGIGYGDNLLKAKHILQDIIAADERIAMDPPAIVAVKELGDNSVNLTALPYVPVENAPEVHFAITEQVKLRFDAEGISIPFPQRDVHLYQAN
jgi:small conductance mechanosensitive channel